MNARSIIILIVFCVFVTNCDHEERLSKLEKEIQKRNEPFQPDPSLHYNWFNLGQEGHLIIQNRYYVSDIKTTFKQNGFEVTGTVGNLLSMNMYNVKVTCAIKRSSGKDLDVGTTEITNLISGIRSSFSVFVPTAETKVSEIGVSVEYERM